MKIHLDESPVVHRRSAAHKSRGDLRRSNFSDERMNSLPPISAGRRASPPIGESSGISNFYRAVIGATCDMLLGDISPDRFSSRAIQRARGRPSLVG